MKIFRRKKSPQIPNASMSDIAFLLIIFFMSTTKFDVKEGISLVLPPAAKKDAVVLKLETKDMTKIMIGANGDLMWNGAPVVLNQLEGKIKEAMQVNPQMIFSIKTDRGSRYNDMIAVLDRLKVSGAEKISLSTN